MTDEIYVCNLCAEGTILCKNNVEKHYEASHPEFSFINLLEVANHISQQVVTPSGSTTNARSNWTNNTSVPSASAANNEYYCPICGKKGNGFEKKKELQKHFSQKHPEIISTKKLLDQAEKARLAKKQKTRTASMSSVPDSVVSVASDDNDDSGKKKKEKEKKKKKDEETAQEMNSEIDSEYQQEFESSDKFDDFTMGGFICLYAYVFICLYASYLSIYPSIYLPSNHSIPLLPLYFFNPFPV